MSELPERLREAHPNSQQYALGSNILLEAAQEIESLQAQLYEARAECVDPLEQSQQVQGEVVAYYDPRPGVDWAYRFLEPDEIEQEDNRNFFTVPLIANQPAPAAVPEGQAIRLLARVQGWWQNTDGDMPASLEQDIAALLTACPAPGHAAEADVCQNCETALPEGCGGIFAHTDTACRYGENQQEEAER